MGLESIMLNNAALKEKNRHIVAVSWIFVLVDDNDYDLFVC